MDLFIIMIQSGDLKFLNNRTTSLCHILSCSLIIPTNKFTQEYPIISRRQNHVNLCLCMSHTSNGSGWLSGLLQSIYKSRDRTNFPNHQVAKAIRTLRISASNTLAEASNLKFPDTRNGFAQRSLGCKGDYWPAASSKMTVSAPKGFLAVYVGEDQVHKKRFLVPISYLNQPSFQDLLSKTDEEFGFDYSMCGLTIPCPEDTFINVTSWLQ